MYDAGMDECCKISYNGEDPGCLKNDCPTYREIVADRRLSLRLDEGDPDERDAVRGVVSASRAVLDGMRSAPRVREDDVRLQMRRAAVERLQEQVARRRLSGVEELILLMRYLPESFVTQFLRLIDRTVGEQNLGSGRGVGVEGSGKEYGARSGVQVKSEGKDYRGGAVKKGKPSSAVNMPIRSEERMYDLDRYRKRLRGMAREIENLLTERGDSRPILRRRCSGFCKRLGDKDHKFCPNCGSPMADVVQENDKK